MEDNIEETKEALVRDAKEYSRMIRQAYNTKMLTDAMTRMKTILTHSLDQYNIAVIKHKLESKQRHLTSLINDSNDLNVTTEAKKQLLDVEDALLDVKFQEQRVSFEHSILSDQPRKI